jgi:hypothetical protein
MTDYFDHVERDLRTAVRNHAHLPWWVRLRLRHSRTLVVVLVGLVVAGPALAAVTLLRSGSPLGPAVPPSPTRFDGAAIPSGVRLLGIRVPDPDGGPLWGMRTIQTTRGLLCVQVGRVAFGTIGALGRDGAFGNDGRFHAFSVNYEQGPQCVTPDAHGNGFQNVGEFGMPASGLYAGQQGACLPPSPLPPQAPAHARPQIGQQREVHRLGRAICPTADLRQIDYGLLGPDAVSITYETPAGRLITKRTTGPDGAYLVVLPYQTSTRGQTGTLEVGDALFADGIRAVTYRNGHSCHLPSPNVYGAATVSCQPVGYASPTGPVPTPAQVTAPVSAHLVIAKSYCTRGQIIMACANGPRAGWQRIGQLGPDYALAVIRFTARVGVTNGHSYYYVQTCNPSGGRPIPQWFKRLSRRKFECFYGGSDGPTESDYKAGTRITYTVGVPLRPAGVIHGDVSLVITTGPSQPGPTPATPGQNISRNVGHFTIKVP